MQQGIAFRSHPGVCEHWIAESLAWWGAAVLARAVLPVAETEEACTMCPDDCGLRRHV